MRKWLLTLVLCLFPFSGLAQDLDDAVLTIEPVKDGLYVIYGPGGNIGVSTGADGVFIVDDQFAPLTPRILDLIRSISDAPVRFVINTHWHPDHAGGNEPFGEAGAIIIAHENTRSHLATDQVLEQFNATIPRSPDAALPVVTFSDEASLHLNGDNVRLLHIPHSHTDGDIAVWFQKANVLHMGDAFLMQGFPLVDWSSGGSIDGMLAGLERTIEMIDDETIIIPGHGELTNRSTMMAIRDIIQTIRDRIQAMIEDGMSVDEIVAAHPTAEWDESMTNPYVTGESLTRAIHHTLTEPLSHEHD